MTGLIISTTKQSPWPPMTLAQPDGKWGMLAICQWSLLKHLCTDEEPLIVLLLRLVCALVLQAQLIFSPKLPPSCISHSRFQFLFCFPPPLPHLSFFIDWEQQRIPIPIHHSEREDTINRLLTESHLQYKARPPRPKFSLAKAALQSLIPTTRASTVQ